MIRQTSNYDSDQQHETARPGSPVSCVTWFVSLDLPEGIAIWPAYADEDLLLSALSVLVFHLVLAESVDQFNTADLACDERGLSRQDNELQWLEDTRAYLLCLAEGVQPDLDLCEAWDRFCQIHTRRIHRATQSSGLSAAHAEDCAQDVWIVILDVLRRSGHDPRWHRFSCWMRGLIHNQVVNFVRKATRRLDRRVEPLRDAIPGHDFDPVATYERNERRGLVRHVLTDLKQQVSPTNYRLVHFRWIEECEVAEVATRLELTSDQVRCRQHRVKKRLAHLLELHGEPSE